MHIARYLPLLTGRASSRLNRRAGQQARCASGLTLHVANPAEILNGIAQRYANAPRLIMEYVDNAIDDAEEVGLKLHKSTDVYNRTSAITARPTQPMLKFK